MAEAQRAESELQIQQKRYRAKLIAEPALLADVVVAQRTATTTVRRRSLDEEAVANVRPSNRISDAKQAMIAPREKLSITASINTISFDAVRRIWPRRNSRSWQSQTIGGTRKGPNTLGSLNGPAAREFS